MSNPVYLDHAATTPLLPAAAEAMAHGFAIWANPSSPHRAGRAARSALEDARARIAAALDWTGEVILTSGASEALALAIGRAQMPLVAVSAVEHEAVLRIDAIFDEEAEHQRPARRATPRRAAESGRPARGGSRDLGARRLIQDVSECRCRNGHRLNAKALGYVQPAPARRPDLPQQQRGRTGATRRSPG